MKVFLDGGLTEDSLIKDLLEPGFLFGWGVFETLRVYNKKPAFLSEHIKRLRQGCERIFLEFPGIDFKKEISRLLEENNLTNAYCRITVFKKRKSTGVMIYTADFKYYTDEDYKKGFKAVVSPIAKNSRHPLCGIKPISYLDSRYAWKIAQDKGVEEAIFLNEKGFLAEGSRTNLFFIKGKTLFTPSLECGILNGITRVKAIETIKSQGYRLEEGEFQLEGLLNSDEACLTSSLMEVMPLVEVEGKSIGSGKPGGISSDILSGYRDLVARD